VGVCIYASALGRDSRSLRRPGYRRRFPTVCPSALAEWRAPAIVGVGSGVLPLRAELEAGPVLEIDVNEMRDPDNRATSSPVPARDSALNDTHSGRRRASD
jgi:hypothetical protein